MQHSSRLLYALRFLEMIEPPSWRMHGETGWEFQQKLFGNIRRHLIFITRAANDRFTSST
jgi:hypothetical protein